MALLRAAFVGAALSALTLGTMAPTAFAPPVPRSTAGLSAVRVFAKTGFPARRIYAPAADAQLRVITCGGVLDRARREYSGNVVLFAHLVGVRPAAG